MRSPLPCVFALALCTACSTAPPPDPPREVAGTSPPVETTVPVASASSAVAPPASPTPCGALGCMQYPTAVAAFEAALVDKPIIVAVGEAHAQKGTEHIDTATLRFTRDLLPRVAPQSSDLVLELMIPDPKCKKTTAKVENKVEKPVTKSQASSNKTEFQKMAEKAKGMKVRPHVLRPNCEQLQQVADAGDDGVLKMLSLIAHLTDDMARRILARNEKTSVAKGVVLYGGAMHNDLDVVPGRESFSFGPALSKHVAGRYVEIDLIVPEHIKDNDTWRKLPWFEHYDKAKLGDRPTLFATGPKSYTLVFAAAESPNR